MVSPQTLARHSLKRPSPRTTLSHPKNTKIINNNNSTINGQKKRINNEFAWMKHGIGRLTAAATTVSIPRHHNSQTQPSTTTTSTKCTKLTRLSHKAPMRWLPLQSSRVEKAGAAVAAMSNYGAGLLPGDVNTVELQCRKDARLGILTQGSNRIYKQQKQTQTSTTNTPSLQPPQVAKSTLQAHVEQGGFLVVAPDPTVPFASSRFHQQQSFVVHPEASLIAVDWFSAGRIANGERWQANFISSETKLSLLRSSSPNNELEGEEEELLVWDATTLDQTQASSLLGGDLGNPFGFDLGQHSFNSFASMLLFGKESLPVVEQLLSLQHQLASPFTRLRNNNNNNHNQNTASSALQLGTTGRVLLGVNKLEVACSATDGPVHMARFVAVSNEDLYRIFRSAMKPLAPMFGLEFYQDRIRASSSGPVPVTSMKSSSSSPKTSPTVFSSIEVPKQQHHHHQQQEQHSSGRTDSNTSQESLSWKAYMLADSALPTGSFAHSSGLETASQLGLLLPGNNERIDTIPVKSGQKDIDSHTRNIQVFVEAATRSTVQQSTPWTVTGHDLGSRSLLFKDDDIAGIAALLEEWKRLDRHVHAATVSNTMACRASLDQGRNLLRVAIPWLDQESASSCSSPPANASLAFFKGVQEHVTKMNGKSTGHLAPLFGILGGALELPPEETCHVLAFCVARDLVSAAVRLNLLGPLASVGVLSCAQMASKEGLLTSRASQGNNGNGINGMDAGKDLLWSIPLMGGCSPMVDAIHPCHDLLSVRLFRT